MKLTIDEAEIRLDEIKSDIIHLAEEANVIVADLESKGCNPRKRWITDILLAVIMNQ